MNLVQMAWENAKVERMRELLDQWRPPAESAGTNPAASSHQAGETSPTPVAEDFRSFEWHYWNRLAHLDQMSLGGHTESVTSVAFSADGKRLASASTDGTVKVWDARPWTPELQAEQQAEQQAVNLIRFLFGKGLSQADVLQSIAADATITDLVRHRATELARDWK